ncbi:MAG TPA: hypothetical protein VN408_09250 [Actinoplanes sp.]|nr:hypothetical protein [Actinoplanes sp.]
MRRAALYLGGLLMATGTTMAMAAPAQAAPAGCYDIVGYGNNIVLVSELYSVGWEDPYIYGGFAFPSYKVFKVFRANPYYMRSFYRVYDSFYDLDAYSYGGGYGYGGSYGGYNSINSINSINAINSTVNSNNNNDNSSSLLRIG